MSNLKDLSTIVISMGEIIGKLNSFFTDSVILRMNYQIEALGSEVEEIIGSTSSEMGGRSFLEICADMQLPDVINDEIRRGYFDGVVTSFLNRQNQPIKVSISGFYLGLISEINGYIILKVKLLEDNTFLQKELVTKKRELDSFIYRTAHDLRGPIATIKGLVNLMKMRQGEHEVDELTSLIEVHANKLDDRLFKLLYVADDNRDAEDCNGVLDVEKLQCVLRKTLKDNFQIDNTIFDINASEQCIAYINEVRFARLLQNVILYVVGLPISAISREGNIVIAIGLEVLDRKVKVQMRAKGFLAGDNIREIICQPVSLYNDILNYPFLFNYYVAQREAKQMNGLLSINFINRDEQILDLTIPRNFSLLLRENETASRAIPGLKR